MSNHELTPPVLPTFESPAVFAQHLIDAFEPSEVLALEHHLVQLIDDGPDEGRQATESFYNEQFTRSLHLLPQLDQAYAQSVFAAFVNSPDDVQRMFIGDQLWKVVRFDHDYYYGLMERLVRDVSLEASGGVIDRLVEEYVSKVENREYEAVQAWLDSVGITWYKAQRLWDAYQGARTSRNFHHVGATALAKLVALAEAQDA